MEPEKKKRTKKTLADHVAKLDAQIKAAIEHIEELRQRRRVLIENAEAKAKDALAAVKAASAPGAIAAGE